MRRTRALFFFVVVRTPIRLLSLPHRRANYTELPKNRIEPPRQQITLRRIRVAVCCHGGPATLLARWPTTLYSSNCRGEPTGIFRRSHSRGIVASAGQAGADASTDDVADTPLGRGPAILVGGPLAGWQMHSPAIASGAERTKLTTTGVSRSLKRVQAESSAGNDRSVGQLVVSGFRFPPGRAGRSLHRRDQSRFLG